MKNLLSKIAYIVYVANQKYDLMKESNKLHLNLGVWLVLTIMLGKGVTMLMALTWVARYWYIKGILMEWIPDGLMNLEEKTE